MHFGKTVLASAAAGMPASGNTTPSAEKFSDSISRQQASTSPANGNSFISFNPAHPDNIFRVSEEKTESAQGSLFEENPSFAQLGKYARAGNDVGSSSGKAILMNRALRAEALNILKLYAEGKLEEDIPVLQESKDYSKFFITDSITAFSIDAYKGIQDDDFDLHNMPTIVAWLGHIFKKDNDFTKEENNVKLLYKNEAERQHRNPLSVQEREELLREIAVIEQQNEHSASHEMKAFFRNEAETLAMAWVINQLRRRLVNRWAA